MNVSFKATDEERALVRKIVARYCAALAKHGMAHPDGTSLQMDLVAVHANGCPLDFQRLLDADDFTVVHDVGGVSRHLDRCTGHLTRCFLPRTARKTDNDDNP